MAEQPPTQYNGRATGQPDTLRDLPHGNKPCRCLLAETNQTELAATITDYVKNIPPELKTPPAEYLHRLKICKSCAHLRDGMCVLCGCYVEARAAKQKQRCVEDAARWQVK